MKLSVFLVGFSATAVVVWLFAFLEEVQARPAALRAPIAAVHSPLADPRPAPTIVVRSLDAG